MKYNLSKIMIKAWEYRGKGLTQSEALKKAWKDVKTSKEILFVLKSELEEQLKAVQYQIDNIENPIPKIKTFTIEKNVRDNIKVWGAIITGLDKKYGFKREFKSYKYINDCSSKHVYYDYYIDIEEGKFFETSETSSYKNKRNYYQLKDGEFNSVTTKDIMEDFNGKAIS